MTAYYNEIDPQAAQWLRNLITAGLISPGDVDERSIIDVRPDDLRGYTQCHFFAGIGVWSYALRQAGWSDDRPVWTGSCPCQPFSSAGVQAGFADERHLWPHFHYLIEQCRPAVVFGEQVASKAVEPWVDLVQTDLEAVGYAFAGIPFPSAGVGAPHIRDRLFWVANSGGERLNRIDLCVPGEPRQNRPETDWRRKAVQRGRFLSAREIAGIHYEGRFVDPARGLADTDGKQQPHGQPGVCDVDAPGGREQGSAEASGLRGDIRPGPTNGFWADADWLLCRDEKWRPVEPGTFPLVDGAPARVVRLRAYGNAINAEAAKEFIASYMEATMER